MRNKKGQSVVEYIVVWSALVAAVLVLAYSKLSPAVDKMMGTSATVIENAMIKLNDAL